MAKGPYCYVVRHPVKGWFRLGPAFENRNEAREWFLANGRNAKILPNKLLSQRGWEYQRIARTAAERRETELVIETQEIKQEL